MKQIISTLYKYYNNKHFKLCTLLNNKHQTSSLLRLIISYTLILLLPLKHHLILLLITLLNLITPHTI